MTYRLETNWHPRALSDYKYVYAVLARRSGGISIGINLNPAKDCNYNCIYCEVDRKIRTARQEIDLAALEPELAQLLATFRSGEIFQYAPFDHLALENRNLRDIAFSGDGEPTAFRNFADCVRLVDTQLKQAGLSKIKIVVITNATYLNKNRVVAGLEVLDQCGGEIWTKLDAGTQEYMSLVNQTRFSIDTLLDNIARAGQTRAIVIQSMFMNIRGEPPPLTELDAYINRLKELQRHNTRINLVQVYTIARAPAESYATPLPPQSIDAIVERIIAETGLKAKPYY